MICYVDSSVLLRYLFGVDQRFAETSACEAVGSSRLLQVECARVIERYRLTGALDDRQTAETHGLLARLLEGLHLIEITPAILDRASQSFPTVVGTLDALHLASALEWRSTRANLFLLTDDSQMETCARALGIGMWGPS